MRSYDLITKNWQLKFSAFAIAFVLWLMVQGGKPYRYRMQHVPVTVVNRDPAWMVSSEPQPATVPVEFRGPFRDLVGLPDAKPSIVIPIDKVRDTAAVYILRREWVSLGDANHDVTVGSIRADTIRVSFDRIATRLVTLRAKYTGQLPAGYELAGLPIIYPPVVRATGASRSLAKLDTIELAPIDLSAMRANDTTTVTIDTTGLRANLTPRRIRVTLPIRLKR